MKKVFIILSLFLITFGLAGCGKTISNVVLDNMSEITKEYYFGENENFIATINVGERESEFNYDGKHTENVPNALLVLKFKTPIEEKAIWLQVASGDKDVRVEAILNEFSETYMVDLTDKISLQDEVYVNYNGENALLTKVSSTFSIQYDKAVEIACENLNEKLEPLKSFSRFNGECYLQVLNQKENGLDDFYWCFSCVTGDEKSFSIVLSTIDGSILANS